MEDLPSCLTAPVVQRYADNLRADDDRILNLLEVRTGSDWALFEKEMRDESNMSEAFALQSGLVHQWDGIDRQVDPAWPEAARQIQAAGMILPPRLTSPNYFAACDMAKNFKAAD